METMLSQPHSTITCTLQMAVLLAGEQLGDAALMIEAFEALQGKSGIPQASWLHVMCVMCRASLWQPPV